MSDTYTVKDVTSDLRYVLGLTNIFEADEDGYWKMIGSDGRYIHKLDKNDDPREIVLIQDPMPRGNYLTFNPFSEGMGKPSPANLLYYRTIRVALNSTISQVINHVAGQILEAKKAADGKKEDYAVSQGVIRVSSLPIGKRQTIYDVIDEDTLKELSTMFERLDNGLIHVPYYTPTMTAKVTCDALTDPEFDAKYGKDIRKKSMQVFRALVMGLLGITKPEELSEFDEKYDPSVKSAPRFHTTMMVYFKLYSKFNDLIADAFGFDNYVIDLTRLLATIERFPFAYAIGKHMMQPTVSTVKPTETKTSDTQGLRFATPGQNGQAPRARFSNPPIGTGSFGGGGFGGQAQSLSMAPTQQTGRFQPDVVKDNTDPFAPVTRGNGQGTGNGLSMGTSFSGGFSGGFNAGTGFGPRNFGGGGFGGQSQFNFNSPSNFNMPGTNRTFQNR